MYFSKYPGTKLVLQFNSRYLKAINLDGPVPQFLSFSVPVLVGTQNSQSQTTQVLRTGTAVRPYLGIRIPQINTGTGTGGRLRQRIKFSTSK